MKLEALNDGTAVIVRPLTMADLDRVHRYFCSLPAEDRRYLRFDVAKRQIVEWLIREAEAGRAYRCVAVVNDEIVGHGALEITADGWHRHIGEIRALVLQDYRGRGMGALLFAHLFHAAERRGVQKVVIKMAGPQITARKACERLGFSVDAVLPDHVKDSDGNLHPLVVMSIGLDEVSKAMRDFYKDDDWPDG